MFFIATPAYFYHFMVPCRYTVIPTASPSPRMVFLNKFMGFAGFQRQKTVVIYSLDFSSRGHIKGPFPGAEMMKKGLRRQIDKTSIKAAGLKSVKPSRVIQSTDCADGDINGAAKKYQ